MCWTHTSWVVQVAQLVKHSPRLQSTMGSNLTSCLLHLCLATSPCCWHMHYGVGRLCVVLLPRSAPTTEWDFTEPKDSGLRFAFVWTSTNWVALVTLLLERCLHCRVSWVRILPRAARNKSFPGCNWLALGLLPHLVVTTHTKILRV